MRHLSGSRKIYAYGSIILGLILLIWPGSALRMVAYAAGIIIMAGGVTAVLAHFRRKPRTAAGGANLLVGIVVTLIGGWIFLNPENFAAVIPTAVGYLIVISGIVKLLETFSLSRARYSSWWLSLLAAVATIFMGLLLVNHAFGIASVIVRIGGAFLLFSGISDLWVAGRVDRYVKYGKKGKQFSSERAGRAAGTSDRRGTASGNAAGTSGRRGTASGGAQRPSASGPEIIDAKEGDYREIQ